MEKIVTRLRVCRGRGISTPMDPTLSGVCWPPAPPPPLPHLLHRSHSQLELRGNWQPINQMSIIWTCASHTPNYDHLYIYKIAWYGHKCDTTRHVSESGTSTKAGQFVLVYFSSQKWSNHSMPYLAMLLSHLDPDAMFADVCISFGSRYKYGMLTYKLDPLEVWYIMTLILSGTKWISHFNFADQCIKLSSHRLQGR